ncbi:MAG: argininosuccinate lyase [Bacteroidetes bacterium]|nr:MAG: argininosuccinate lyase [Bacteroidota bacterium]
MATLWAKDTLTSKKIEHFTTGKDRELDLYLAPFDILGSMAHITMLETINLLSKEELQILKNELIALYLDAKNGKFVIEKGVEDVHSQVEFLLTKKLGDVGKKIHSGRSRNDQVLVDLKLFMRDKLEQVVNQTQLLFDLLQQKSEEYKDVIFPGYTHYQVAMPSSFGLWFGAYSESLADDLNPLLAAYKVVNKNPLGSAAGYGSSFPLNRTLTTQLLGFETLNYNVVYAQMTRGKADIIVAQALSSVAYTLNKLASDAVHYVCQNFDFISFPEELMEGSSIMPHKKNPDVFELIRAKTNKIKALPNDISLLTTNMPSGYHRDLQLVKEYILPAFDELIMCMDLTIEMLSKVSIKKDIAKDEKYKFMFSVERVNELVLQGVAFRDAYKIIGKEIAENNFKIPDTVLHTHEGSIGNLCTNEIKALFYDGIKAFNFNKKNIAIEKLIGS